MPMSIFDNCVQIGESAFYDPVIDVTISRFYIHDIGAATVIAIL